MSYSNTLLTPYGKACLELLENDFSVFRINRMRNATLAKTLKKCGVSKSNSTAEKIKAYIDKVIPPSETEVKYLSRSLGYYIRNYRVLNESINYEENVMAEQLVQSPYFYLITIPGVAVVIAGNIAGEIGEPSKWNYPSKIASYGGIAAKEKQTGGSDKKAVQLSLPKNCNRRLKDSLIQVGFNMGKFTHPAGKYLEHLGRHKPYEDFLKAESRGSKSGLCTAKKFLKISKSMILNEHIYYPQYYIAQAIKPIDEERIVWYRAVIDMLKKKWAPYDLSGVADEKNNFKKTIEALKEIIKLIYNRTDTDS